MTHSLHRLRLLTLPLILLAGTFHQLAAQTTTLSGTVTDRDGDSIPAARITLTVDTQPPLVSLTTPDGRFTFANLSAGPFSLTIAATGFAPHQTSGILQPGETRELPSISLTSATVTNVEVTATQVQIAEAQIHVEEQQRVFGAIPNFYVVYDPNPAPLSTRQKFSLAWKTQIDPANLLLTGVIAGVEQADHAYAWELGASGYGKRYAASYGSFLTGNFLTGAIFPTLFKQDPRYYYKGTGSIRHRALYAIANAVICKGDNGHWQTNYSAILGSLAASGISNFYYPSVNRAGATLTFEGAAIGTGFTAVANLLQEFAIRKITTHHPNPTPPKP